MAQPSEVQIPATGEAAPNFSIRASGPKGNAEQPGANDYVGEGDGAEVHPQTFEEKQETAPRGEARSRGNVQRKVMPRAIPLAMKVQSLNEQVDVHKARRSKAVCHKKRRKPHRTRMKRQATADEAPAERKILDGFLLLHSCRVKNPQQAVKSKLVGENIVEVEEGDLLFFQNLTYLNLSENRVRMEQLVNLKALRELHLQYNFIKSLQIEPGMFPGLEVLSLGFNAVPAGHLLQLAQLPNLRVLDLSGNELCIMPEDLAAFRRLEELNLSSNNFSSDSVVVEPGKLFKSLSTIPHLKRLNLSHNALKGTSPPSPPRHPLRTPAPRERV
jgi:hypothetical protein